MVGEDVPNAFALELMSLTEVVDSVLGERESRMYSHPLDPRLEVRGGLFGVCHEDSRLLVKPLKVRQLASLDETNAESAMREPENYRAQVGEKIDSSTIELKPFGLARLDGQLSGV